MNKQIRCAEDDNVIAQLKTSFPNISFYTNFDGEYLRISIPERSILKRVLSCLKNNMGYKFLMDLFGIDYLRLLEQNFNKRFKVVYNLYSYDKNHRVFIDIPLSENEAELETVVDLWDSANWFEREIYDMYGIKFRDHPNLTRILMYEGFEGYPLRKDYPINRRQPIIGPID